MSEFAQNFQESLNCLAPVASQQVFAPPGARRDGTGVWGCARASAALCR